MEDIFENIIICKNCKKEMKKGTIVKDGFILRYAYCEKCKEKFWHPQDVYEYNHFKNLKKKTFLVKLRFVGNSYAITLPKEIINFINEIEKEFNIKKERQVKIMLEEIGKINLIFDEIENKIKKLIE
ncbi:MAG: hypothetical protein QXO12_00285 [Candidatus Pacearchaeota archaeon]